MRKDETKKTLQKLFHELAEKAEVLKQVSPTLYFLTVNQAIGVLKAAHALGVPFEEPPASDSPEPQLPL